MSRPLIAVAGRIAAAGRVSRSSIAFAGRVYLDAVLRAGGEPVTLSPRELRPEDAAELLSRFDGLVLMGGADVDPHLYGQTRQSHVYGVNTEQDHFEMALVHAAVEAKKPTLAVCRGIQLVNVALGGTLIQHIASRAFSITHRASFRLVRSTRCTTCRSPRGPNCRRPWVRPRPASLRSIIKGST